MTVKHFHQYKVVTLTGGEFYLNLGYDSSLVAQHPGAKVYGRNRLNDYVGSPQWSEWEQVI